MDTAPKDGRAVYLWDGASQYVAAWGPVSDSWRASSGWVYGWTICGEYNQSLTVDNPTHWAELLPPPNEE